MDTKLTTLLERIPDILQLLHKQYVHHLNAHLKGRITAEQFFLLKQIARCGRCNSSNLSKLIHVNNSSISIMINRLVEKGYVRRVHNKHDRRIIWLEITEESEPILSEGLAIMDKVVKIYLTELTPDECATFITLGTKMYSALQESE